MQVWYHASQESKVPGSITALRQPSIENYDVHEISFCVAPTVWQCLIATGYTGTIYIYEAKVRSPEPAEFVEDFKQTQEHRITQHVLDAEGGEIPIRRIGLIDVDEQLLMELRKLFCRNSYQCDAAMEKVILWRFDNDVRNRKFDVSELLIHFS